MTWKLFSFTVICLAFIWLRSWWVPTSSVLCSRKRKDGPKIVYREAFLSGFSSSSACQWSAKTHPSRCPSLPLNIKHLSEASPGIKNGVFTPCIPFGGCRLEAGWHKGEKSAFLVLEHFVFFHSATYNMGLYKSGEKKKKSLVCHDLPCHDLSRLPSRSCTSFGEASTITNNTVQSEGRSWLVPTHAFCSTSLSLAQEVF